MLGRAQDRVPLDVYLKVNTGMNRLGFTRTHLRAAWNALRRASAGRRRSPLMTHFADADGEARHRAAQLAVVRRS